MNDSPFDVNEEIEIGDMSDVQGNELLPAASKVLYTIKKASIGEVLKDGKSPKSEENPVVRKKLRLDLRIKEGIEVNGQMKFIGKPCFIDIVVWANPEFNTTEWYKTKKFLFPFKQFIIALGYDPKVPPKVGDTFCSELMGREIRNDIKQKPVQVFDKEKDEWVDTSDLKNEYTNWRAA